MDTRAVEGAARRLYELAGADVDQPMWTPKLARLVLGVGCIQWADASKMRSEGSLVRIGDRYRIYVRKNLPPERLSHVIGHELGHWICKQDGYRGPDLEAVCDAIGAALVAPKPAFHAALRALGVDNLPGLAKVFTASQSLVALRAGETTGRPMALVAPSTVRVRGDEFAWPATEEIRQLATRSRPGLKRTKLTDEPRRVMVAAG